MSQTELFAPLDPRRKEWLLPNRGIAFHPSFWQTTWKKLTSQRFALAFLWVIFVVILMAAVGPFLSHYSYDETHLAFKNQPPDAQFWFGTDELGRDLFTRCWWGARISLFIGIAAAFIDGVLGVLYGSFAGYIGKKTDECMMRIADILSAIPYLLIVILLMVFLGPGMKSILIGLTATGWITMARIVRSQVIQLKQQDFILAAYGLGASRTRILFHHLLPNMIGPIIVTATFTIPYAIFAEAFLSFLGLGVQAPIASWGALAYEGLAALRFYPWRLFIPTLLLSLTILSFNVVGEALRDALDIKVKS